MEKRIVDTNIEGRTASILVWFIYVVSVLAVLARLGTRYAMIRKLEADDYLMLAAQAAYLGQCIAVAISSTDGLGTPAGELSDGAIERYLKAEYASIVFYFVSLALIKWSISSFIRQLSPTAIHKKFDWALRSVILSWLLSAVFISLFQCELPKPWDYIHGQKCIDKRAWWSYAAAVNIVTDLFSVASYVAVIAKLQIPRSKKAVILSIFLSRLLVVGATIAQLVVFLEIFSFSDPTKTSWVPVVLNQVTLALSTTTACAPYLKPFMESLESGVVRVENLDGSQEELSRNMGLSGFGGSGSYSLRDTKRSSVAVSHSGK